ncbi:MAG: cupredoxin domain-containing protein [Actinomycetota bacterium]
MTEQEVDVMSGTRIIRRLAVLTIAAFAVALWPAASFAGSGGCPHGLTQGRGETVQMSQACFGPGVLHTDPGAEVTFVNRDPIVHNVSALGWGSAENLREGQRFTATFEKDGVYPFACTYHFGMTGAVVVGDGIGAGSGRSITVEPVSSESRPPVAMEQSGGQSDRPGPGARPVGVVVAGALGLLVGATLVAVIRRRGRQD